MLKHKQKITNKEEKMGRKILIAGNWKMNGLLADGTNLAKGVAEAVKKLGKPQCEFLVCPPFTLLTSVKKAAYGRYQPGYVKRLRLSVCDFGPLREESQSRREFRVG